MVPEGWVRVEIGCVCSSIIDCVNKTAPVVDEETPYRMIRTTNVRHGRIDVENVRYVTEETFRLWTRRGDLQDGDIILTREAPVGEVGQVIKAKGLFLGQRTMLFRADPTKMDQSFLFQSMISPDLQRQYHADSAGGTVAHIRVPDCSKFLLNVPPLPEQKKIADVLSTWDKAIETTEKLLANAEAQKRTLMQQLLTGKRRLNGCEGPWKVSQLDALATIKKGQQKSKLTLLNEGEFPVINGGIVPSGYTDEWNSKPGTITISEGGNSCGFVNLIEKKFWSGGHCYTLEDLGIRRDFLFHYLKFKEPEIMRLRVGSGLPNIQKKAISAFQVAVPPREEQERIEAVLNGARREVRIRSDQIVTLHKEKRALVQQLLSGKRRVKV